MALIAACMPQSTEEVEPLSGPGERGELHFIALEADPSDPVAARVGDTVITVGDVRREAAAMGLTDTPQALLTTDAAYRDTLSDLVDRRLLALAAVERDLYTTPEALRQLAAAEERILANILVQGAISNAVTEEAIEAVYEEQGRLAPRTEEIRARHILVETQDEAVEVARLLAEGSDFAQLAAQVSQDISTQFNGGDLGYFTRAGIITGFAQIAFETAEGARSAPFQTEYGWHVLEVVDRRWQPRQSLEDVRPNIVRFLTLQGIDDLLGVLRDRYPVTRVAAEPPSALRTTIPEAQSAPLEDEGAAPEDPPRP